MASANELAPSRAPAPSFAWLFLGKVVLLFVTILVVWIIYGTLAGIAGVLLGMFLGVSSYSAGPLTGSAFSIVVLGGLGSVSGSLIAAYIVGYIETLTAYFDQIFGTSLGSTSYRFIPSLLLLIVVMYVRPRGLLGRR